ncbi:hypothetical protein V8C42DRAFT_316553 [Trichoderma barbatum]
MGSPLLLVLFIPVRVPSYVTSFLIGSNTALLRNSPCATSPHSRYEGGELESTLVGESSCHLSRHGLATPPSLVASSAPPHSNQTRLGPD